MSLVRVDSSFSRAMRLWTNGGKAGDSKSLRRWGILDVAFYDSGSLRLRGAAALRAFASRLHGVVEKISERSL